MKKAKEAGVPYGARQHMPFWFSLAWSSRGVANAINVILVGYVTFYCTDLLGLNALVVGGMLVASKIIDAFTDLGIGYIIDRTHTKWGKARPYEFFIVLEWLFTILLFTVPNDMKEGEYDVYLRFAAPLKDEAVGSVPRRPIRFANADMWNDELKANAFGKVEVR